MGSVAKAPRGWWCLRGSFCLSCFLSNVDGVVVDVPVARMDPRVRLRAPEWETPGLGLAMVSPIEHFVTRSLGTWTAQRSGHNLAFRHVEEVESEIRIAPVAPEDPQLMELLASNHVESGAMCCPFSVTWQGTSDWDENATSDGSCLLVPVPESDTTGRLLRSQGYTETIPAVGRYRFGDDGTFVLVTPYERASAEERVWFATDDLRLRVALMRTSSGRGVLQASFSSEIRQRSA